MYDIDISNCNRLFWLRNNYDEAVRLWNIGKQIGFTCSGEDNIIIDRIIEMEEKENNNKKEKDKEGNTDNAK